MGKGDPPKDYIQSVDFPHDIQLRAIGVVRSPYTERWGTPRQSTVTTPQYQEPQEAILELFPNVVPTSALTDLETFSHVWVIAWLHLNKHWNPMVFPPRGPRKKRGTLATRAPHRPNQLGLSAAEIVRVEGPRVTVRGIDLLNGTPILDIKPYLPYADSFPDADIGWVKECETPSED